MNKIKIIILTVLITSLFFFGGLYADNYFENYKNELYIEGYNQGAKQGLLDPSINQRLAYMSENGSIQFISLQEGCYNYLLALQNQNTGVKQNE